MFIVIRPIWKSIALGIPLIVLSHKRNEQESDTSVDVFTILTYQFNYHYNFLTENCFDILSQSAGQSKYRKSQHPNLNE